MKCSPSVWPVSSSFWLLCSRFSPVCLSDCVSSGLLFNCIIKPFSYSSRSVSEPPPCTSSVSPPTASNQWNCTGPSSPSDFLNTVLSLFLWMRLPPSRCAFFSLRLSLWILFPPVSLSARLSLPLSHCLSVSQSVISAGQLICFHKTFSVLRWLDLKMSDESQRAVVSFFFFDTHNVPLSVSHKCRRVSTYTWTDSNISASSTSPHRRTCTHFFASSHCPHTYVRWLIIIGNAFFYLWEHTHLVVTKDSETHSYNTYTV